MPRHHIGFVVGGFFLIQWWLIIINIIICDSLIYPISMHLHVYPYLYTSMHPSSVNPHSPPSPIFPPVSTSTHHTSHTHTSTHKFTHLHIYNPTTTATTPITAATTTEARSSFSAPPVKGAASVVEAAGAGVDVDVGGACGVDDGGLGEEPAGVEAVAGAEGVLGEAAAGLGEETALGAEAPAAGELGGTPAAGVGGAEGALETWLVVTVWVFVASAVLALRRVGQAGLLGVGQTGQDMKTVVVAVVVTPAAGVVVVAVVVTVVVAMLVARLLRRELAAVVAAVVVLAKLELLPGTMGEPEDWGRTGAVPEDWGTGAEPDAAIVGTLRVDVALPELVGRVDAAAPELVAAAGVVPFRIVKRAEVIVAPGTIGVLLWGQVGQTTGA